MVTDSWEQAKRGVAWVFSRRGRSGVAEDDTRAALEEERAQLVSARDTDGERAAVRHVEAGLVQRLRRLLAEEPESADELRQVLTDIGAQRVPGNAQINGDVNYYLPPSPPPAAADGQVPDEVPVLRTPFVNREAELTYLDGAVAPGGDSAHVDVLVLGGTPGVGKSATASRWAHRVRDRFPGGQLYVDFAKLRGQRGGSDVSAAVEACLRSLGGGEDTPPSLAEQTRLFRSRSAGRRILLVLDDVNEPAQVRALVPQGAGSAVLVTSNAKLGELALDGARLMSLDPLERESALRILADRCGEEVVAAERETAEQLVDLCGGLPVALHVVAARLVRSRRLTLARLVQELTDDTRRLTAMSLGGEASVSAVFDSAYRQLAADEARFYRLLGWLPGRTFDAGAAAAVAATDTQTAQSLLDVLEEVGLVTVADQDRYRLHDLVQLHARERASAEEEAGTQRAVIERLVSHYLLLTAFADRAVRERRLRTAALEAVPGAAVNPFTRDGAPEPLDWLDWERPNILAVLRTAAEFDLHSPVLLVAEAFTALFLNRRYVQDWKESLELGRAAAAAVEAPDAEARLGSLLSRPLMDVGDHEQAREQLERALARAEVAGRTDLRASVLEFAGRYWDRVDPERAIEMYRRSFDLNTEAGEERGAAIALLFLGSAQVAAGSPDRALTTLWQAHAALLEGEEPDPRMAARALLAIGRAHDRLGDCDQAIAALSQATAVLRERGATHYEAEALLELADIAERQGERAKLREHLSRALDIHDKGGSPRAEELRERLRRLDGDREA